jgi:hypothetical protein
MRMKYLSKFLIPTESEIAAHHAGMNVFFGAVLGFVMAGTERLDSLEFAYVLLVVSAVVISILYVSASRQKIAYSLFTVLLIFMLPRVSNLALDQGEALPDKLQPTLLVWTFLSIFIEFMPRRSDNSERPAAEA